MSVVRDTRRSESSKATVEVKVPGRMQGFVGKVKSVQAVGGTIREVLADLDARYPGGHDYLFAEDGKLQRFVGIYLNGQDIRSLKGLETRVKDGDSVAIVLAIGGG